MEMQIKVTKTKHSTLTKMNKRQKQGNNKMIVPNAKEDTETHC